MKKYLTGALLLAASPAAAQDVGVRLHAVRLDRPVTNKLDTRFGRVESETSGSDALSDLDFAFMAALEARHGRWGLVGDLLYVDLSSEADTPLGRLFDSVETELRSTAFSGYAFYRAVEQPQFALDVGGGFRAYSARASIRARARPAPRR